MLHLPLFSHPLGWVVIGAAVYLLYKSGKRAGQKEKEEIDTPRSSEKVQKEKPAKA